MKKPRPTVYTLLRLNPYGMNFIEAHAYNAEELEPFMNSLKKKFPKAFFRIHITG